MGGEGGVVGVEGLVDGEIGVLDGGLRASEVTSGHTFTSEEQNNRIETKQCIIPIPATPRVKIIPKVIPKKQSYVKVSEFKPKPDTVNAPFCASFYFPTRRNARPATSPPSHGQLVVVAVVARKELPIPRQRKSTPSKISGTT